MGDDRSFAARWSARKQAVEAEEAKPEVVEKTPPEPEKTDAEILTGLNLKDPDDMEAGDDFSGFMNAAIPRRLRNRALRKLWATNPELGVVDGLLDYGEDFTGKGDVVGVFATAYQVGKGFLTEQDEEETLAPVDSPIDAETTEIDEDENPALDVASEIPSAITEEPDTSPLGDDPEPARRKRMNFRF